MALVTWTYTLTDSLTGLPLAGVYVWASSDKEGATVVDSATTDASGVVSLQTEDGEDVWLWSSFAGYRFTNPDLQQAVTTGTAATGTGTAIVAAVPDAVTLPETVNDLITDALLEIGVLAQGETAEIEDAKQALSRLNRMLDSWRARRLLAYRIRIDRHTLTAAQQIHTIGPSGDFLADRPAKITRANIIVTGVSPEVRYPLQIVETAEEWMEVSSPALSANVPQALYCDYAHPDASLYLYPYPAAAYDLELSTWAQLTRFGELTDPVSFPPGYADALMLSLAEKLCTSFTVDPMTRAQISRDAAKARALIVSVNSKPPKIRTRDSGVPTAASWS